LGLPWQVRGAQVQTTGECGSDRIAEALRLIEANVLLSPVDKERLEEAESARVKVLTAISAMA
jgi:hypothetical protein